MNKRVTRMTTIRKRSSGFSKSPEEPTFDPEKEKIEQPCEEIKKPVQKVVEQKTKTVVEPVPFIEESITPTPDPGPRFVQPEAEREPEKPLPTGSIGPKKMGRKQRNVPRFSK